MWAWPEIRLKPGAGVVLVSMYPGFLYLWIAMWSYTYFGSICVHWPKCAGVGYRYWEQSHYRNLTQVKGYTE